MAETNVFTTRKAAKDIIQGSMFISMIKSVTNINISYILPGKIWLESVGIDGTGMFMPIKLIGHVAKHCNHMVNGLDEAPNLVLNILSSILSVICI